MKYRNRHPVKLYFELKDFEAYREAATAARMDFSQWVNAQCGRAVKRDARVINNRDRATVPASNNRDRKAAKGE